MQGRSMIEMLGVLAIIGVLSIGGLYAYKQAMTRYRSSESVSFISFLQFATIDLCSSDNKCPFIAALADEDYKKNSRILCAYDKRFCSSRPTELYGGWYVFASTHDYQPNMRLLLANLTKDQCRALVSKPWSRVSRIRVDYNNENPTHPQSTTNNYLTPEQVNILLSDCMLGPDDRLKSLEISWSAV